MQSTLIFMVLLQLNKRTLLFKVCSMSLMHSYMIADVLLLY